MALGPDENRKLWAWAVALGYIFGKEQEHYLEK
jgi:hypothetical protein